MIKRIVIISIMLSCLVLFIFYFTKHPELRSVISSTDIKTIVAIIFLYGLVMVILTFIYDTLIKLCGHLIPLTEQFGITALSSIVNFFGPFQSGPAARTIYYKKRHKVSIKTYGIMAILYYSIFAAISSIFLLAGLISNGLLLLLFSLISCVAAIFFWNIKKKSRLSMKGKKHLVFNLILLTSLQLLVIVIIYGIELRSVGVDFSIKQIVAYAGAANFALFVSITPGAIGFREAFLYFSHRLHDIDGQSIIAANVLDRSIYVVFLGMLALSIYFARHIWRIKLNDLDRQN